MKSRTWNLVHPTPGYPATIPYRGSHMGAAWSFEPGSPIFACFYPDGRQTYRGDSAGLYVLA